MYTNNCLLDEDDFNFVSEHFGGKNPVFQDEVAGMGRGDISDTAILLDMLDLW